MTRAVWKYELATGLNTLTMPQGAVVLSIREQHDRIALWALVDPEASVSAGPYECPTWPQCSHPCLREGEAIGQATDFADGKAMRLLLAALPPQAEVSVSRSIESGNVRVKIGAAWMARPTLAEAADACRAALVAK